MLIAAMQMLGMAINTSMFLRTLDTLLLVAISKSMII
jgi:hypothetical protein